jgi:hypothetical protein
MHYFGKNLWFICQAAIDWCLTNHSLVPDNDLVPLIFSLAGNCCSVDNKRFAAERHHLIISTAAILDKIFCSPFSKAASKNINLFSRRHNIILKLTINF